MALRSIAAFIVLLAVLARSNAAPMVSVGPHPTSTLTPYPRIQTLRAFEGRIYMGSGDWNNYPAVTLTSYDPATHRFLNEYSVNSDSIERLRVIGDTLFAPSIDPIHYEDFKDYSYRKAGGAWRDVLAVGSLHIFDMARTSEGLFAAGGNGLWRSADDGKTWAKVYSTGRLHWCYALGGRLYTGGGYWENQFMAGGSTFPNNSVAETDAHTVTIAGQEVALIRSGTTLYRHNIGSAPVSIRSNVSAFTWSGDSCYTIEGFTLYRGTFTSPTSVSFAAVPVGLPSGATAIEVWNGKVYIGTSLGALWVGNLDGSAPPNLGGALVQNIIPDQFGRGLAWDGDRLLVGAPDASPPQVSAILGGQVQRWLPPAELGGAWTLGATFSAPTPDYSGWFGKDVCAHGDYMAIVETGRDTTNRDRGSSSVVHLYLKTADTWAPQVTLNIPFAHSVSILNGMLAVGAANAAANQAAGQASVHLYSLTQQDAVLSATFLRQITPGHSTSVYKPTTRALLIGDYLVGGFAGDPSRFSGSGMVSVGARNSTGTDVAGFTFSTPESGGRPGYCLAGESPHLAVGVPWTAGAGSVPAGMVSLYEIGPADAVTVRGQLSSPISDQLAEFGTGLAMRNGWLLVGAPGAERAGRRHAGRVFAYRQVTAGNYELRGEIPAPPASQGEFGIEIAAGPDAFAIGSRFSTPGASLEDRVMIVPANATNAYDFWAAAKRLPTGAAGIAADPDGDGLTNLAEYACDTDPKNPDGFDAKVTGRGAPSLRSGPIPALIFHRPSLDPCLTEALYESSDLQEWQKVNATSILEQSFGSYERRRFDLPNTAESHRFYRVAYRYAP